MNFTASSAAVEETWQAKWNCWEYASLSACKSVFGHTLSSHHYIFYHLLYNTHCWWCHWVPKLVVTSLSSWKQRFIPEQNQLKNENSYGGKKKLGGCHCCITKWSWVWLLFGVHVLLPCKLCLCTLFSVCLVIKSALFFNFLAKNTAQLIVN